ncbi:MAG: hypothetical protein CL431_05140 [Acidimicrobiaceae bacterium]|nr:hypothetical protein [Acidimicrobiaceae bacterium]
MNKTVTYSEDKRRHFLLVILGFCTLFISWRLIDLSIFNNTKYEQRGVNQRVIEREIKGERGSILDRNGYELAISFPQPFIYIDPQLTDNGVEKSQILANYLDLPGIDESQEAKTILTKFNSPTRFEYIIRKATLESAEQILELNLGGVYIDYEPRRFHISGDQLARGVLGGTTVDNIGSSGLELQYEMELKGTTGIQRVELSADGSTIPTEAETIREAVHGSDLILTIDRALQSQVELELSTTIQEAQAKGGIVIIQRPATGEILAMASMISTETGEVLSTSYNQAVTLSYEPASVLKAMTFAGVINEGLGVGSTRREIPDTWTLEWENNEGNTELEIWRDEYEYGTQEMAIEDILTHSSNTGTILWAQDLGQQRLYSYLEKFGFGQNSGLEFPYESQGILHDLDGWDPSNLNTISLGHGISVTPIQLVSAYSAIANDGVYVSPRLVSHIVDPDGNMERISGSASREVISASTAHQMADLLTAVVENGTGEKASVNGYRVAAKTGTSWKYFAPEDSYESPDGQFDPYLDKNGQRHYTSTVTGFFPSQKPELSMIVIIDDPAPIEEQFYASHVAAPLFGKLASWSLRHYQISPFKEIQLSRNDQQALSNPTEGVPFPNRGDSE